jgi:RNA polymerase sigma-70 factor (ECF subfamily)
MASQSQIAGQSDPASLPEEVVPDDGAKSRAFIAPAPISKAQIAEFYTAVRPSMVSALRYRRLAVEDIEDIIQEVFLRLLVRSPKNLDADTVRFWLLRVARNLATDIQRSGGRCPFDQIETFDSVISIMPSRDPNPEELYHYAEKWQRVRDGLAMLTPRQRHAIDLRITGLSCKEIAERLKSTPHSVEELIRRGLKRLARGCNDEQLLEF